MFVIFTRFLLKVVTSKTVLFVKKSDAGLFQSLKKLNLISIQGNHKLFQFNAEFMADLIYV